MPERQCLDDFAELYTTYFCHCVHTTYLLAGSSLITCEHLIT